MKFCGQLGKRPWVDDGLVEAQDDVKGKLDSLASTTAGFREVFNTNVEAGYRWL